jgi:hypothetical protein
MSMFLSRDELVDLSGARQRRRVIAWLRGAGYRFEIGADGWPRVLRAAVEARLMPDAGKRTVRSQEPDLSVYGQTPKAA